VSSDFYDSAEAGLYYYSAYSSAASYY